MFSRKKYVFETDETRLSRRIKDIAIFLVSSFLVYSIVCFILLLVSKQESSESRAYFYKRSPDLIVVFTGDKGRIPHAISLAKKYKLSNILISGVNLKNNIEKILANIDSTDINLNYLDLDYNARNTVENVRETLQHIRKNKGYENVIILSHDYHILRIKAIAKNQIRKSDEFNLFYLGLNTNLGTMRGVKILYKEVFKFFRTIAYLWLADID